MTTASTWDDYDTRVREWMERVSKKPFPLNSADAEDTFNAFALELFALQFERNRAYRGFCEARGISPKGMACWSDLPAVPASAFRELEMTSLAPLDRQVVFCSSGTTGHRPSRHFHNAQSLGLYEASLLPWFQAHVLFELSHAEAESKCGVGVGEFLILTPSPTEAPRSSLVHMFETVRRQFGARSSTFYGGIGHDGAWLLDCGRLGGRLDEAQRANRPVVLLGTAFQFVHLLDHLGEHRLRYALPEGSRVLETGGYKGRSRALPKSELYPLLNEHLSLPSSWIVCEYGMSELSSQAYDTVAGQPGNAEPGTRRFRFPPWARVRIVSPETGREVQDGEAGLIRIVDLANMRSVLAVQTEDIGVRRGTEFEFVGRVATAEPRGCSLQAV
jgi:hypothetical protein